MMGAGGRGDTRHGSSVGVAMHVMRGQERLLLRPQECIDIG